jgi:hypothetical protein
MLYDGIGYFVVLAGMGVLSRLGYALHPEPAVNILNLLLYKQDHDIQVKYTLSLLLNSLNRATLIIRQLGMDQ